MRRACAEMLNSCMLLFDVVIVRTGPASATLSALHMVPASILSVSLIGSESRTTVFRLPFVSVVVVLFLPVRLMSMSSWLGTSVFASFVISNKMFHRIA